MQRSLTPILAGYIAVAALVFAAPKPALATSAVAPAVANASIVQQIGYRHYRGYRNYGYRNYGYRNYGYRRYGYGGYGYRPYGYGYRPYGYYGVWLSLLAPGYQPLVRFLTTRAITSQILVIVAPLFHCLAHHARACRLGRRALAAAARRPAINHMFTLIAAAQRTMI